MPEEILAEKQFNFVPFIIGINKNEFGWILPMVRMWGPFWLPSPTPPISAHGGSSFSRHPLPLNPGQLSCHISMGGMDISVGELHQHGPTATWGPLFPNTLTVFQSKNPTVWVPGASAGKPTGQMGRPRLGEDGLGAKRGGLSPCGPSPWPGASPAPP